MKNNANPEDYIKWTEDYKGPFLLGLKSAKRFTLLRVLGSVKGDAVKGIPPEETKPPPFQFIGIMEISSLEDFQQDLESKAYQEEFTPEWNNNWGADFYILTTEQVYHGESD